MITRRSFFKRIAAIAVLPALLHVKPEPKPGILDDNLDLKPNQIHWVNDTHIGVMWKGQQGPPIMLISKEAAENQAEVAKKILGMI